MRVGDDDKGMSHNRPRGMLSESEREYLAGTGDVEPNSQQERNLRSRIRERLLNGLIDISLVLEQIEDRDLELVLDNIMDRSVEEAEEYYKGIDDLIGLTYLLCEHRARRGTESKSGGELFEQSLETGLRTALARLEVQLYDIDFEMFVGPAEYDDLLVKLNKQEKLSKEEIETLVAAGLIDEMYEFKPVLEPDADVE